MAPDGAARSCCPFFIDLLGIGGDCGRPLVHVLPSLAARTPPLVCMLCSTALGPDPSAGSFDVAHPVFASHDGVHSISSYVRSRPCPCHSIAAPASTEARSAPDLVPLPLFFSVVFVCSYLALI